MAAKGEPFIIAKAGKPMVKVVPLEPPVEKKMQRLGFMRGKYKFPDDIKAPFKEEIDIRGRSKRSSGRAGS